DGRANTGELAAALAAATARGVPISAIPSPEVTGDPAIAAIVVPPELLRPGATVTGHVEVDAAGATGPARVTIRVAGAEVAALDVALTGGRTEVPFSYALPDSIAPGPLPVEATLALPAGAADRDPTNDTAHARLVVQPPPRILILDGDRDGAAPLAAALRAERMEVTVVPAAPDGPPPELADIDLVILANAPVRAGLSTGVIDDAFGERLVRWIDDGGGLLVLGGPSALDGNYAANRLADALPVEIEPMTPQLDASATVIVILDQSGSMGEDAGGRTKLELAAEGASAVIRLLRSFDRIGVMAVEDRVHWLVPVREIGNDGPALEARVRRVPVGGDGIFVYTSLVAAQRALAGSTTPLRHVILFSDTFDAAEQVKGIDYGTRRGWPSGDTNSFAVARALRASGTTVSVIGVGAGADRAFSAASYVDDDDDTDFLRQLAAEGGGRYYRTTDAKQLRGLFVQDARRLLDSKAREEKIEVRAVAPHPALAGVELARAPRLDGFQEVKPRPAAQVVVTDRAGNPILVRWPYGLGEVAVWASDAGPRWARSWLDWPGYARFWTQLVRASLRRREGDASAIEIEHAGDAALVRVVRRGDHTTGREPAPRARIAGAGELPLRVISPGVFEARMPVAQGIEPTVELLDDRGAVAARRTIVAPSSSELRARGPDLPALEAIARATGGTLGAPAPPAPRPVETSTPLAPWFVLLAIMMLPLDAHLRRPVRP
ncbi:MAG: glutamine amidotransferase, partial [Kofleriaceae bacterium]